jgi:hypothetical protein
VLDVLFSGLKASPDSLNVLYGGLDQKRFFLNFSCIFSSIFGHQYTGSGFDPDQDSLEMLDPDPNSMNPDPTHCSLPFLQFLQWRIAIDR